MGKTQDLRIEAEELVGFIRAATEEVFTTMLGAEAKMGEPFKERAANAPSSGIVSLVGLAGKWVGTGSISCTASMACAISSAFLMAEYAEVNEEVLDAFAELTNMIIGNVKTHVEAKLGPMGLSIPTLIFGQNFQTRNAGNHEWVMVPFLFAGETMHVQFCLTPNRDLEGRTLRPEFPIPQLVTL